MWIIMKETYDEGAGLLPKGHKLDLPPDILKLIPKDCYEKCCAPWNEQVDHKAIELTAAENKAKDTQAKFDKLQDDIDGANHRVTQLTGLVENKDHDTDKAEQAAKQAAAKAENAAKNADKAPSKENIATAARLKETATELSLQAQRSSFERKKVNGQLTTAEAEADLISLDGYEAKIKAMAAANELEELKTELARKRVKAKAKAEAEEKARAEAEAAETEITMEDIQ